MWMCSRRMVCLAKFFRICVFCGRIVGFDIITSTPSSNLTILKNVWTLGTAAPVAPFNLQSSTIASDSYNLSWSHASALLSFNVYMTTSADGSGWLVVSPIANKATGKSYISQLLGNARKNKFTILTGLDPTQTYYWSVQARDLTYHDGLFASHACFDANCPSSSPSATTTTTTTNSNIALRSASHLQLF